jgi:cytochrome c oxidase accessory protein FixG
MTETSCPHRAPSLLSPWRRRCQWGTTILLLLTPWFRIDGNSLLRIDIPGLRLYFFGQTLRIEELYLILLFSLALTVGFLLITMLMGRVWCGWLCPQTTLTDLAEWFSSRLGLRPKRPSHQRRYGHQFILQSIYLLLAFLVSANLLWYFIEPLNFFDQLASGQLHYAAWIFLLLVTLTIYLDLALVRRLMCSDFCPYGRFQSALADQATLTLHLPPAELERCIKCNSCVRVCPMQIDIRNGYQIECINCGRCLDACRQVMAKRNQPGLICYTFGTAGKGDGALLNLRTLLLGAATLALIVIFLTAIYQRPAASLKISVSHTVASRILKDGNRATFFNAWVNNRSSEKTIYYIAARRNDNGKSLTLKGQTDQLALAAGENLRIDFVLVTPVTKSRLDVDFILRDRSGTELAVTQAHIR